MTTALQVPRSSPIPRLVPIPDLEPPRRPARGTPTPRTPTASDPAGTSIRPDRRREPVSGASVAGSPSRRGAITRPWLQAAPPSSPRPVRVRIIEESAVPTWDVAGEVAIRRSATHDLPAPRSVGPTLARAIVEVLSGRRPAAQLCGYLAPRIFAGLQEELRQRRYGPLRLSSVRLCEPADGVAELSAVFRSSTRAHAMALRLEGIDGRWRITAIHLA